MDFQNEIQGHCAELSAGESRISRHVNEIKTLNHNAHLKDSKIREHESSITTLKSTITARDSTINDPETSMNLISEKNLNSE